MKRLGVVVPIYNGENYLGKCIESICRQQLENMEIILVDDGSTDHTEKICQEYAEKDTRIRVVKQANKGKIEARYAGVVNSSADYITFVDADDWIASNTYVSLWPYVEKNIDIIAYRIVRYINLNYQVESRDSIADGIYYADEYREIVCKNMIWDSGKNGFGVDPSLCNKLFKRNLLLQALENARQISVGYGDDVAVLYPLMLHAESYAVKDNFAYFHRKREMGRVPEYFEDSAFFEKLTLLYGYVKSQIGENERYIEQLDLFYLHSVNFRMECISKKSVIKSYLFPFEKIPKGSKIVLYGAGKVGKSYYNQILESHYCEVVEWIDNDRKTGFNSSIQIANEQIIQHVEFDYVVIAIKNESVAKQISNKLCNEYDLKRQQIIWNNHEFCLA